ncbi:hypothetical protein [Microbacterium laevaniformans]|uniref:hypothetical protein n=1 Tax=Microbacterium laevaniformans TaxID=36807 RepID=UPI00362BA70F
MSREKLEADVESLRSQADSAQRDLASRTKQINDDESLSDVGKRDQLEQVRESTKARLKDLRRREEQLIDDELTTLRVRIESRSGTSSSDIIAFRDAQDRADRFQNADEARPVLERALRQQDKSLAAAIFRRAIESGWGSVVQAYTNAHPESADLIREIELLTREKENGLMRSVPYMVMW